MARERRWKDLRDELEELCARFGCAVAVLCQGLERKGRPGCPQLPRGLVLLLGRTLFKTPLDMVLCSLLWVTLLQQGVGLGDPQRALPAPTMLGFCDSPSGALSEWGVAVGRTGWGGGDKICSPLPIVCSQKSGESPARSGGVQVQEGPTVCCWERSLSAARDTEIRDAPGSRAPEETGASHTWPASPGGGISVPGARGSHRDPPRADDLPAAGGTPLVWSPSPLVFGPWQT